MSPQDPVALVVILVRRHTSRSAMSRIVKPAIAAEVDAAVNLAWHVMPVGKIDRFCRAGQRANAGSFGVILKNKSVALRSQVVADCRIVFRSDRQSVSPNTPGTSEIILLGVVQKIDLRRNLRDLDVGTQPRLRLQQVD